MSRYARLTTVSWGPQSTEGDPIEGNVQQACETIDRAAGEGGDILCLSELLAHRNMERDEAIERAEPVPGPITEHIGQAAERNSCYVVAGMLERNEGQVYNSAVLIGRDGAVVGTYRKMFPTPEEIGDGTMPGITAPVFDTDFGRVGIAICWDLHFLQVGAEMAQQGVELICWPSAYQGGFQLRMWAYLFGAYVMSSWPGNISEIIDMNGYSLAATNYGYNIASADVNFERDVFLRCTGRSRWDDIRNAYGDRISMELMHAQGTFSIASEEEGLTVGEIAEEFDLDRRIPYYEYCHDLRENALASEDGG